MNWSDFPRESLGFYLEKAGAASYKGTFSLLSPHLWICTVLGSDPENKNHLHHVSNKEQLKNVSN